MVVRAGLSSVRSSITMIVPFKLYSDQYCMYLPFSLPPDPASNSRSHDFPPLRLREYFSFLFLIFLVSRNPSLSWGYHKMDNWVSFFPRNFMHGPPSGEIPVVPHVGWSNLYLEELLPKFSIPPVDVRSSQGGQ